MSIKLNEYKKLLSIKTSEQLLGVIEAPKDTCPMIDDLVDKTKSSYTNIESLSSSMYNLEKPELENSLSEINSIASWGYVDSELEDIRTNVQEIREWGQQWKDLAKYLFERYGNEQDLESGMIDKLDQLKTKAL